MSELLEGLSRSPRFIRRANGPHEVWYDLLASRSLRPFEIQGASRRARVGRVRRLVFFSILRVVLR